MAGFFFYYFRQTGNPVDFRKNCNFNYFNRRELTLSNTNDSVFISKQFSFQK